jgi:hypothetical protein
MAAADVLALLVASCQQMSIGSEAEKYGAAARVARIEARSATKWAWIILLLMIAATVAYAWLNHDRDGDEVIRGLPPGQD